MSNRTIEAVLRLSAKLGSLQAFDTMAGKLDQVDRKAQAFNRTQGVMARVAGSANSAFLRFGGAAAVGGAVTYAVGKFAEVERNMTRIGLTLGASRDDMKGLYRDIDQYANRYALQSDQVRETVAAYAAAGADLADIRSDLALLTKAQQAIDASGQDTVNTWDSARKSLGLATKDAERFFEIVAAGGAAGKFEAKDMAQYLPSLLPSAAKQGFEGLDGANRIVGFLEVMADFTGSAGQAATAVGDFLEKLSSPDVEKRLDKISGSFVKRMKEARDNGGDMLQVVHDILKEATGNDASRLGQIFGDKEARAAATVILTKMDEIRTAQREISANAPGVLDRNVGELLNDTQAKLDRLGQTWSDIWTTAGESIVDSGVVDAIDTLTEDLRRVTAAYRAGWTPVESLKGILNGKNDFDVESEFAWRGGYRSPQQMKLIEAYGQYGQSRKDVPGREPTFGFRMQGGIPVPVARDNSAFAREPSFGFRMDANGVPVPAAPPARVPDREVYVPFEDKLVGLPQDLMTRRDAAEARGARIDGGGRRADANYDEFMRAAAMGGDEIERGGREAGSHITDAAREINAAGGAFKAMLDGVGKQIGADIRSQIEAGVKGLTVTVKAAAAIPTPRADTGVSQAGGSR